MAASDDLDVDGDGRARDVCGGVQGVESGVKHTVRHQNIPTASILLETTLVQVHGLVWGEGEGGAVKFKKMISWLPCLVAS